MNGKESWYTSALVILQQLNINASMSLDEIQINKKIYGIMGKNSYMKMQLLRKGKWELITDLRMFAGYNFDFSTSGFYLFE